MFVTDISRFEEAARAHREAFGEARPATTMVEVRRLVHPDMLIEIEADAYAGSAERSSPPHAEASRPGPDAARVRPSKPVAKPPPAQAPEPKPKPRAAKKPPPRKPSKRR